MSNARATRLLAQAIDAGATPGAVLVTGTRDAIILEQSFGHFTYDAGAPPVRPDTIYDLASLTKVIVTTPVAMLLHERGQLDLESPARSYVPEFAGGLKDAVTVEDLLAHCGGLLWWSDLYKQLEGRTVPDAKRRFVEAVCARPLEYPPRTKSVYSDLGFVLLGEVLERVSGSPLDRLAAAEIFGPLEMREAHFNPPDALRGRIAPTEDDAWRGCVLRGVVHDENAFILGGVAPHAGLFASARTVAPFAQMLLNRGTWEGRRLLSAQTIRRFTRRANLVSGSSRALGWDTPSPGSSCGELFSPESFGHTGFTGTSLWIDPVRDFFVILLTNRVYPTRDNPKLASLRPSLHDALAEDLITA